MWQIIVAVALLPGSWLGSSTDEVDPTKGFLIGDALVVNYMLREDDYLWLYYKIT